MTLQEENKMLRELLSEASDEIKMYAVQVDGEWGSCRTWEELVEQGEANDLALEIDAALPRQAEPASAQGERDSFKRYRLAGEFCVSRGIDDDSEIRPKILDAFCSGYACADRPTLTEQQPVKLQHMACVENGIFRWATGRKIDNCELYAMPDFGRAPQLYAAHPDN